jgi:hypothetical protein
MIKSYGKNKYEVKIEKRNIEYLKKERETKNI